MRDARDEAERRLDGRYRALVLEPSPPALGVPWFADDPTDPDNVADGTDRPVVSPVGNGDVTWEELCRDDLDLALWCWPRGLAGLPRLDEQLSHAFVATRQALQAVAEHVLCPARFHANGKIGLRFTMGGFGTPFFSTGGVTRQVRIEGGVLIVEDGEGTHRHALTTLGAAAEVVGVPLGAPTEIFTPTTVADPDLPVAVDEVAAARLGDWYGLAASVLEQLRADAPAGNPPSRVQLWPEHFDLATDLGDEAERTRVTFGASPGDEPNPEPYLYVLPWAEVERGGFWNAESFTGAILPYAQLAAAHEPREAALDFFRRGHAAVAG